MTRLGHRFDIALTRETDRHPFVVTLTGEDTLNGAVTGAAADAR
jgi:hypothetical protein